MSESRLSTGAKIECAAYVAIAVLALIGTQWALIEGIKAAEGSFTKQAWIDLTANPTVVFTSIDLLMVFLAAMIFMIVEGRRARVRWWWLYPVLSCGIGISFGFPLFLLARGLRVAGQSAG
jgi:hypothetical protein